MSGAIRGDGMHRVALMLDGPGLIGSGACSITEMSEVRMCCSLAESYGSKNCSGGTRWQQLFAFLRLCLSFQSCATLVCSRVAGFWP
ncbi:hypothetical protein, partial [Vulcanococcus sp.]|uniref:hypothetical protein n=1 Tax=Vulcanococcus sp. TaxID=2856995 RepID=UPI0037D9C586